MALPQGIAFRSTLGFVTDGAHDYAEVLAIGSYPNYPTTSTQGNTVGWEQAPTSKFDYNAGVDARVSGIHGRTKVALSDYRIDLPASGSYNIRSAIGDTNYAVDTVGALFDTSSQLVVLASGTNAAAGFKDATNVERSTANWPSANAAYAATFTTTICRFRIGDPLGNKNTSVAYVYVEAAAASFNPGRAYGATKTIGGAF